MGRKMVEQIEDHKWWRDVKVVVSDDEVGKIASPMLDKEECWVWTGNPSAIRVHKGKQRRLRPLLVEALRPEAEEGVDWMVRVLIPGDDCATMDCINPWHQVEAANGAMQKVKRMHTVAATRNLEKPTKDQEFRANGDRLMRVSAYAGEKLILLLGSKFRGMSGTNWDYDEMVPGKGGFIRVDASAELDEVVYVVSAEADAPEPWRSKIEHELVVMLKTADLNVVDVGVRALMDETLIERAVEGWRAHRLEAVKGAARRRKR